MSNKNRCTVCGDTKMGPLNSEGQCEDCSLICEVCSKPHYDCNGFDDDNRICYDCAEELNTDIEAHFGQRGRIWA